MLSHGSVLLFCLVIGALPVLAQAPQGWVGNPTAVPILRTIRAIPVSSDQEAESQDVARESLMSLALPGWGQHEQGKNRKWFFAVLEVAAWAFFWEREAAGARLRDRYRDFAWAEARFHSVARADADFDYYETLTKWTRSGAFDANPARSGVQPETDGTSFNGSIWELAVNMFLASGGSGEGDPDHVRALEFYKERAYGPGFLWDWSGLPDGQQRLAGLISESDDRFRQATTMIGVVIANHVISAVDAFLVARGASSLGLLEFEPRRGPRGIGWSAQFTLLLGS